MIELQNVTKSYVIGKVTETALKNVSLTIKKGEYISIVGPSGSGKSTLMNILGLIDTATKGTYLLKGNDVSTFIRDDAAEIRNKEIGFIFQSYNLLPTFDIYRNIELPLIYANVEKSERKKMVLDVLERVGLSSKAHVLPNQLSGGQKQRVAIARALVNNPSFLLADEPTGALDQKTGQNILDLFNKLHQDGITIIMVTHDANVASKAQRVIKVQDGEIVSDK